MILRYEVKQSFDHASWLMITSLAFPLAILQYTDPFSFRWGDLTVLFLSTGALTSSAIFYTRIRPCVQLACVAVAIQQMIVFCATASILSYMVASRGDELWDARLQQWDRWAGLDWLAFVRMVDATPTLVMALKLAYVSLIPQMIVLILALGFSQRVHALRVCIAAAILAGGIAVMTSGAIPAVGYYVHLNLSLDGFANVKPAAGFIHMADFEALRAGELRSISIGQLEGIVTFPSYHAALATIFAWGFLHSPLIRWPGITIAILTLVATPVDGGHYFVDVLAGILIAIAAITIASRLVLIDMTRVTALLPRLQPSATSEGTLIPHMASILPKN